MKFFLFMFGFFNFRSFFCKNDKTDFEKQIDSSTLQSTEESFPRRVGNTFYSIGKNVMDVVSYLDEGIQSNILPYKWFRSQSGYVQIGAFAGLVASIYFGHKNFLEKSGLLNLDTAAILREEYGDEEFGRGGFGNSLDGDDTRLPHHRRALPHHRRALLEMPKKSAQTDSESGAEKVKQLVFKFEYLSECRFDGVEINTVIEMVDEAQDHLGNFVQWDLAIVVYVIGRFILDCRQHYGSDNIEFQKLLSSVRGFLNAWFPLAQDQIMNFHSDALIKIIM